MSIAIKCCINIIYIFYSFSHIYVYLIVFFKWHIFNTILLKNEEIVIYIEYIIVNKKKLLHLLSEKELNKLPYKEIEEYCSKIIKELVESEKEVRENEKY